jgi:hypothetical protein
MRAAIMKEQGLTRENSYQNVSDNSDSDNFTNGKRPAHRPVKNRVLNAVSKETGMSADTVAKRLKAVEPDVGVIDLEDDSPAEHHACGNHEGAGTCANGGLCKRFA